jgi:hypothetical protein
MIDVNTIKDFRVNANGCVPFCESYNNMLRSKDKIFRNIDQIRVLKYKTVSKELSTFLTNHNSHITKFAASYRIPHD